MNDKKLRELLTLTVIADIEAAGYVIVPRKPTEAMLEADGNRIARHTWQAAIDAAAAKETAA